MAKSDTYNITMLLWIIISMITTVKWFGVVACFMAIIWGILMLVNIFKEENE